MEGDGATPRRSEQRGVVGSTGGAVIGPLPTPPPDQGTDEEQPRHIVRIVTGNHYGGQPLENEVNFLFI